nr:uncharacterized protein LOC108122564 [Drosophila bipectinata]
MESRLSFSRLLVILCLLIYEDTISASKFKFTNFVCSSVDPSWLVVHQCRLKAIRRDWVALNFNVTLLQTIRKAKVHGQIFKRASGYKPWLYNFTLDGCRFLRNPYMPVAAIIFNRFKQHSNLNHTCPYSGSVFIMGVQVFAEEIPVPLPSGDYLILIKWYFSSNLNCSTDLGISSGIYFS